MRIGSPWRATTKVPLMVAALMAAVGTVMSLLVLDRLEDEQSRYLAELSGSLLDGVTLAVSPAVLRRDVWETFDILDRAVRAPRDLRPVWLVASLPDHSVLASSDPLRFGVGSMLDAAEAGEVVDDKDGIARLSRAIEDDGIAIGRITAAIDTAPLVAVRREVTSTLIAVNAALTLLFALAGYAAVRGLVRPVVRVTEFVGKQDGGVVVPIPEDSGWPREMRPLIERYNAMAKASAERDVLAARLAAEEKVTLLGRLASGIAHEVNNPLGGMMTALDTLKRYGTDPTVRARSLALIERGLKGIRNVVRSALVSYKGAEDPGALAPSDLDDLQFLLQHETVRRRIALEWRNGLDAPAAVDGGAVRQIALNLLLNACAASPIGGTVTFEAEVREDMLLLAVSDQGRGLPAAMAEILRGAGDGAIPPDGNGLGLWTVARLAARLSGRVEIQVRAGAGTRVALRLPLASEVSHAA